MSAQQGNTPVVPPPTDANKQESVNALLTLLRNLEKNKQPQKQPQQKPQQQAQPVPADARRRLSSSTPSASTSQAAGRPYTPSPLQPTYSQTSNFGGTLNDALQRESASSSQGYTAPPLPNIQTAGQSQAGPSRVRFAPTPSVAVIPSINNDVRPNASQSQYQATNGSMRPKTNVAETNMQILKNMFKNSNSSASRRKQNALLGLLDSIRSGKGISIGRPSQIRPGVALNRDGQGNDLSRKRKRMETPGTGRYREPYVYDPLPRHSPGDHDYHSTADDDDEPVGRPFGPWLPSQIGPDGELLPRKRGRQRILTPEEALARRKERNRLAAQESRRRKAQQLSGTVRKVGELGGELEQTKVKYDELVTTHADLQKRYGELERAHQQLRMDYNVLQDQQNQITDAIEVASRLGDEEFQDFSSEEEDGQHQSNQDESGHNRGRRGGSVSGGDNVISINGVDMNIDEYLAFSLAAAAAAQEDAMEQHHQGNEGMDEDGQSQSRASSGFDRFDENGNNVPDTPIAVIQSFSSGQEPMSVDGAGDPQNDSPIPIDPALQEHTYPQPATSPVSRRDPNALHLPIDIDADDQAIPATTTQGITQVSSNDSTEALVGQEGESKDASHEGESADGPAKMDVTFTSTSPPTHTMTPAISVDFDDDEDDGDFVPENEVNGADGDELADAEEENQSRTSPDPEAMPAQTQDSIMAQATQNPADAMEDQDDEDDEDDEYFRIEEADYEDLFQPIEDVPIPVEDYLDIQAQYQRHLEEFNATLLRQQVAEMIANEDATGISDAAGQPSTSLLPFEDAAEQQRLKDQAYQDTLESLGIDPEAGRTGLQLPL